MIGGLINGLGLSMIGAKPYKTYADLRGTTIGSQTLTSGTGFALRLVMKVHGLEYPRDYKLLNIGSAPDRFRALASGQISSAPVGVPLDLVAKQQGFNIIGYFADDQPNFQFNVYYRQALLGGEKPDAGGSLHESDGCDDALDGGQPRGGLRLSDQGDVDQHGALPLCLRL